MKDIVLAITTHVSDGTATTLAPSGVLGELYAILYVPGTIATGATVTVTCVGIDGSSKPLLTKASAGTSNTWYYPRDLVNAVADGAALTGTAGGDRCYPILAGVVKVAIASGGNSKAGKLVVYYED
jgi:hypothetical protein